MPLYSVVLECAPGYEPATLADRFAWIDALQRGHIEVIAVNEQPPLLADDLDIFDVHAPQPSRLTELELEQERLGDAICNLQGDRDELSARIDAAGRQHAALCERVMDLSARVAQLGQCRDCVWATREGE